MKVLISDPDKNWANQIKSILIEKSVQSTICNHGKDCQLKLYKDSYDSIILDLDTTNNTAIEVLKYLKLNFQQVRIILTASSKKKLDELSLDEASLKKLGVCKILTKPYSLESITKFLEEDLPFTDWKTIPENQNQKSEEEVNESDEEFTSVKIKDFCSGNHAIFDHFIRLAPGKFVKILHRGEKLDHTQINYYSDVKKIEYFYFKIKDRGAYINFINEVLSKAIRSNQENTSAIMSLTKSMAEKYIDEIYTAGLKPQLVEEGIKICQNIFDLVQQDKGLAKALKQYQDYDSPAQAHLFLTAFFSTVIAKNLEWTTPRTAKTITLAALLHDIGKLKLPPELRHISPEVMNDSQRKIYQQHPRFGFDLLEKYPLVSESIKQIVYQHHETTDGAGFPNGLNGHTIYPMAKIVSLANYFSDLLIKEKVSPLIVLNKMVRDEIFIRKFDPQCIRGLILGFVKGKSE